MRRSKKIIKVCAVIIFFVILFTPEIRHYKDGGTVEYHAMVYQVFDWHAMRPSEASNVEKYYGGLEIRIMGRTVFNHAREYEVRYCD